MQSSKEETGFSDAVDGELHRILIAQAAHPPLGILLLVVALVLFVGDHIRLDHRIAWGALVACGVLIRWQLGRIFLSRSEAVDASAQRRRALGLSAILALTGLVAGLLPVAWFGELLLVERALLTVALFAWYASVIVVSLVHPVSAYAFGMCLLGPLTVAWAAQGVSSGLMMGVITLLLLFSVRQTVGHANTAMRGAILARMREADLVRRLEERGIEIEAAMRAKSAFLAAASHDLRQPVTSMSLLLSALQASRDEATMRKVADKLEAPLQALEEILSSLLEMSRLEAGAVKVEPRACQAGAILEAVADEYRHRAAAKGLGLTVDTGRIAVHTDPELLKRILRNLVDNAVKFTDRGGIRMSAVTRGAELEITVSDTGKGIAPDALERVFDDYFQAGNEHRDRRQGLGLGLAIVRRLVDLLGGSVSVSSELGQGTRFLLRVPGVVSAQGDEPGRAVGRRALPTFEVSKMLMVEDDRLVRDGLASVCEALGIEAHFASEAEEAFSMTALGRFQPEAVLVDFGLPGAYDGIEVIEQLRKRLPGAVFVLVTGDTRPEVIRRAVDAGIAILHKPLSLEKLAETLATLRKPVRR